MTSGNGTLLFVVQIMSDLFYKLSIVYTINATNVHFILQEEINACNSRSTVYNKTVVENR